MHYTNTKTEVLDSTNAFNTDIVLLLHILQIAQFKISVELKQDRRCIDRR